ncbi:MAG: phosphoadenosine phosphosulfate reductase family protein [Thermodesulfobacteriota bacterium]
MLTLRDKIEESLSILRYVIDTYEGTLAVTFSGGKDSLVVLHLIRTVCHEIVPIPVFNIDTTVKFPETLEFRDEMARQWHLNLIILKNASAAAKLNIGQDKKTCCQLLKITPLKEALAHYGIQGLITAIRWDEQEIRSNEQPLSPREDPRHMRIHPLLHFSEADVWDYIHAFRLPYCVLYDQGYRSLSCMPCTQKADSTGSERAGREPAKEMVMQDLRLLGYF